MPGGHPTVATPELLAKARVYVAGDWVNHTLQSGRKRVMPTVEGLALYLGISRETIYAREQFSDIVNDLRTNQHDELANGSADGTINPQIGKLMLSSKHGYVEKAQVDNTSSDGSMTPKSPVDKSQLDDIIASLKDKTAKEAE